MVATVSSITVTVVASADCHEQFLLLNIYGLCSGDKRSYEFVEAFQGDLTTVRSKFHLDVLRN